MGTKPILFNTENVRVILDGRKTATRRVVKPQPPASVHTLYRKDETNIWRTHGSSFWFEYQSPYIPGDILWVRETWNCLPIPEPLRGTSKTYWYKADGAAPEDKWRPSIHMPREAARIFLRVTDIQVERLQEITLSGCVKEGISFSMADTRPDQTYGVSSRELFSFVWDHTIKPKDMPAYSWRANPWVWVIEFERISKCGEDADAE